MPFMSGYFISFPGCLISILFKGLDAAIKKKNLAARLLNYGRLFFFKKNFTMVAYSDWSLIRNVIVIEEYGFSSKNLALVY